MTGTEGMMTPPTLPASEAPGRTVLSVFVAGRSGDATAAILSLGAGNDIADVSTRSIVNEMIRMNGAKYDLHRDLVTHRVQVRVITVLERFGVAERDAQTPHLYHVDVASLRRLKAGIEAATEACIKVTRSKFELASFVLRALASRRVARALIALTTVPRSPAELATALGIAKPSARFLVGVLRGTALITDTADGRLSAAPGVADCLAHIAQALPPADTTPNPKMSSAGRAADGAPELTALTAEQESLAARLAAGLSPIRLEVHMDALETLLTEGPHDPLRRMVGSTGEADGRANETDEIPTTFEALAASAEAIKRAQPLVDALQRELQLPEQARARLLRHMVLPATLRLVESAARHPETAVSNAKLAAIAGLEKARVNGALYQLRVDGVMLPRRAGRWSLGGLRPLPEVVELTREVRSHKSRQQSSGEAAHGSPTLRRSAAPEALRPWMGPTAPLPRR